MEGGREGGGMKERERETGDGTRGVGKGGKRLLADDRELGKIKRHTRRRRVPP